MSLFLLMDEHPMSMKEQLDSLIDYQGPKVCIHQASFPGPIWPGKETSISLSVNTDSTPDHQHLHILIVQPFLQSLNCQPLICFSILESHVSGPIDVVSKGS